MISCPNLQGVQALACVSAQTDYIIGYVILILLISMLYFKLQGEPSRERFASILFFIAIVTAMGAIEQMLFPTYWFIVSVTLAIGAVVMLVIRK